MPDKIKPKVTPPARPAKVIEVEPVPVIRLDVKAGLCAACLNPVSGEKCVVCGN